MSVYVFIGLSPRTTKHYRDLPPNQASHTNSISLRGSSLTSSKARWWVDHVGGQVAFHNNVVLVHNLALEYRRLSTATPGETTDDATVRLAKVGRLTTVNHRVQQKLINRIEGEQGNLKERSRSNTPASIKGIPSRSVLEAALLAKLMEMAKENPESDVLARSWADLPQPKQPCEDMSPIDRQAFWVERFRDWDVIMSFFSYFHAVIDVEATFSDAYLAQLLASRYANTADYTYFLVIVPQDDNATIIAVGNAYMRTGIRCNVDKDTVRRNFRHHAANECMEEQGTLEKIMVPLTSKTRARPPPEPASAGPATFNDMPLFQSPPSKRRFDAI